MFQKLLLLAVAGSLGTLARYELGGFVQNQCGKVFAWGTVTVNLLGCLAFGAVWSALEERWPDSGETRAIILIGFMGAFTTFSTFIFETNQLLRDSQWMSALGYFALHNVGGLAALAIGLVVGRLL
ncbi:MAG: CrcB family protein [Planctomycetaceae bacterium]|nr:CrcB family protein [Planctomycetaceae bacterium]